MLLRVAAFLLLCAVSSSCFANETCETIGGRAAGEADYLFEVAKVTSTAQLHFYSAPGSECQLPAFLVNGDTVEVLRSSVLYGKSGGVSPTHPFRYVRYRDTNGAFVTGWVTADELTALPSSLPVKHECQTWADDTLRTRVREAPSANNRYRVQGQARAWFYTMPNEKCRSSSVFLVPGDSVSAQEQSEDDFLEVNWYGPDHRIIRGWLKKSQLAPIDEGDHYRDDINPLSVDKATRIATLSLRTDYHCVFYESWNAQKEIQIIVREDHQSALCRGSADSETSPPVAYISINKQSGEISWPDMADGFDE